MTKKIIFSDKAPKPVGPYSQAVRAGQLVFCAGQVPIDPASGKITATDISAQTEQVIKNIQAVLAAENLTLENVVKTTVFMKDLQDFAKMNDVYARHFKAETAPARSTFQVARLPLDALVELEVIAAADQERTA